MPWFKLFQVSLQVFQDENHECESDDLTLLGILCYRWEHILCRPFKTSSDIFRQLELHSSLGLALSWSTQQHDVMVWHTSLKLIPANYHNLKHRNVT